MIAVRQARPGDAVAIGDVHVAAWRSAYPGILPNEYLTRLSVPRQAAYYDAAIRSSAAVYVATASGCDSAGSTPRIVGFATAGRPRGANGFAHRLADGEIETLYVLDDWRERGLGRRLMQAAAAHLAAAGCRSAFLWVLRDNPSRWFYARLGGRAVAEAAIRVGGQPLVQSAFVWDPIDRLLETNAQAS